MDFTEKDLKVLREAMAIVQRAADLDGDTELTACSKTIELLAENIEEGLEG